MLLFEAIAWQESAFLDWGAWGQLSLEGPRVIGKMFLVLAPLCILAIWFYRLYFHPLSKYPGPWLGAITNISYHWHYIRGDVHLYALKLHNEYGPIVRCGPNILIYIDKGAWKDIYGHRAAGQKPNRSQSFHVAYPGNESVLQAVNEENHNRQRRIFSYAFSEQALRRQEHLFKKYADLLVHKLCARLASQPETPFDIVDYYNFTTFDIMGDLTFSEPLGMLESSEYSPWVKMMFSAVKFGAFALVSRHYTLLNWLAKTVLMSRLLKEAAAFNRFSEERVDRRLEKGTEKPDIWKLVLDQQGDRKLTREEMYSNASLFMIGGTETTATLLSGVTYYLLKTPHALARLRSELDEAFPDGTGLTSDKLGQLKYLTACLQEGLRLYPPLPAGGALRIAPDEGTLVTGRFVPGNTLMGVVQYAANHSAANFTLPSEYHPERWLDGDQADARFVNDDGAAMQPFSFGPRNCLGRNMAWFEMRLIAAQIFLAFDLELCPESDDWIDQKVFILWEKHSLMVKLKKRKSIGT